MLGNLFLKECKQMMKCLTYYVIVICMILMYTSQLGEEKVIIKPEPGQKDYGFTYSEDKSVIMNNTIIQLAREYTHNKYGTYPFGFYKKVTLSKAKQSKILDILTEATGLGKNELKTYMKNNFETYVFDSSKESKSKDLKFKNTKSEQSGTVINNERNPETSLKAASGLTYEHFTEMMTQVDKLLGGGSSYARDELQGNAYVPMTYEQALKEYNDIIQKDHLTGAYARYFCDYFSIILAILPIFIAVTRVLRDKRARAREIIYSRKASSFQIIMSRYLAIVIMLLIPVILLASFMAIACINSGIQTGIAVDYMAFPGYIISWLLPTVMISTSIGMFLTELTDTAIAIIVQGLWWFISLLSGDLIGNCGWNLIPRHNKIGYYKVFKEYFDQFVLNRVIYTIAAILILAATVYIYEMKRKGRVILSGEIFPNRNIKYKA